jgi:hypothetical protein
MRRTVFLLLVTLLVSSAASAQRRPISYIFFGQDREALPTSTAIKSPFFEGAQIAYTWKILEPEKGHYDFSAIESDLDWLAKCGKRLFVQIQDVSFYEFIMNIPDYLRSDTFGGGASRQYEFTNDNDDGALPAGWVSRRWDANVSSRYFLLLSELGKNFDGRIAGINMPETSVDFGSTGRYFPAGFSPEIYRDAIKSYMRAAKGAFKKSIVMQYANFMPGEWLPREDRGYLSSIYEYGKAIGVGLGGPDVKVNKKAQMDHSYRLLPSVSGNVVTGIAVQYGNYEESNPMTGRKVTIADIYRFCQEVLKIDYIFWSTQEPYFERDVLPYLQQLSGNKNSSG